MDTTKQLLLDSFNNFINHPLGAITPPATIAIATPTANTLDAVIKILGIVVGLIPAIKQIFKPKNKKTNVKNN